ncbi:MAG: M28 family peptidase [Armatimonadetes bacterium]|nr:M28 family peptidase [Armatimonadota bacterium]
MRSRQTDARGRQAIRPEWDACVTSLRSPRPTRRDLLAACLALVGSGAAAALLAACQSSGPAADAAPETPALPPVAFDADRAFDDLKRQCTFGPRVPGTQGHVRCRAFLAEALRATADKVELQEFRFRDGDRSLAMANIIARWQGRDPKARAVLLAAHWDTRPTADQEPDPQHRSTPIPGANDGASGVAVLLEVARQLKQQPPPGPVWIVLFDGEDYGPGVERMFLGSRHFARHLPADAPKVGVLLDMVGDAELSLPVEENSLARARDVVAEVWSVARARGYGMTFLNRRAEAIQDDHLPLLDAGVKMIDVIDFDYPYWHTLADTPDKCSAASLRAVGEVITAWVLHGAAR